MKVTSRRHLWRSFAIVLVCVTGVCFGIYKIFSENFEMRVGMCTLFPEFANYRGGAYLDNASIDHLLQRDQFVYRKFTKSFSNPVRVSVLDNGALLYLKRVWKVKDGYLILVSGRDPRGLDFFIRHESEMPGMSEPFEKDVEMTTVTKTFLENYKIVMIPIGSKGVSVHQDESSYTLNGLKVEQAGTGQPATRPESKSVGSDKPQSEAEGRSR